MKQLRKSEIKEVNQIIFENYGVDSFFNPKEKIIEDVVEGSTLLFKDKLPLFFIYDPVIDPAVDGDEKKVDSIWVPTLKTLLQPTYENMLPEVIVDMGAVKFVINGADIMRPGVVSCNLDIKKGDLVVIKDEKNKKSLAVGLALFSGANLIAQEKGKVVSSIHFFNDKIWKA